MKVVHTHILVDVESGLVISTETDKEVFDWVPVLVVLSQKDE